MPYMELRNYSDSDFTPEQRDQLMVVTRDHLERGKEIDGTFEFRYLPKSTNLDYCEYDWLYVIDAGWSKDRNERKTEIARSIGRSIRPVLGTDSFAVRLRLQRAGFVPYEPEY